MDYLVRMLTDGELPPEHAWAVLQLGTSSMVVCIKESRMSAAVVAEAWAAARHLRRQLPLDFEHAVAS